MNKEFLFCENVKMAHLPADLNTAPITGARIKMDGCDRVAIMSVMEDSTGAVVQFTLKQHTADTGGSSKVLAVQNAYYHKAGAATSFTKVELSAAQSLFDVSSVFAAQEGILVIEVMPQDLDVEGGYAWLSVDIADATAAKHASTVYIVEESFSKPAYEVAL